ncbi:hypothetical protein G6F30_011974 [Rhizopus arrhizus]|nr:hypothetical protein G6F30_011974 [Rhizopus arrhizus]
MYLANLARDPANPIPVQPSSSAILAIFMLIGVFALVYLRTKSQQAFLASIFGSIILAFSISQASVVAGFQPTIIYTFLKPIAAATAIALAVDLLIWPDDSMTKYIGILNRSLKEYNAFFQEHAQAFLNPATTPANVTLPSLHARLQGSVLSLIDSKREVQREILWSRMSQKDISLVTRLVKQLRPPLHGIGLSLLANKRDHTELLFEMNKAGQALTDLCVEILDDCNRRLMILGGSRPRTLTSTLLWPFPRLFFSTTKQPTPMARSEWIARLDEAVERYETEARSLSKLTDAKRVFAELFDPTFQAVHHFQFNLIEHTQHLREWIALVERLESTRPSRRLWFPHLGLRKYFLRRQREDANMGGLTSNDVQGPADLALSRTMTVPDSLEREDPESKLFYHRDPDVNPPETFSEHFFHRLYKIIQWCQTVETTFAFKTAAGFVLLTLPAFLPQSAAWFFAWRGQWATVTLMMWMSPMTGVFFFGTVLRVIGTILGGVLGIIVWEITRGNPYGLSVLTFFVMMPLYFLFFTKRILTPGVMMTQITAILVICYEYQYKMSGAAVYDSAEVVAGKRMLLVIIGVAAAAILSMIPKPVTGRVELRKRISVTLQDLSKLYGILVRDIVVNYDKEIESTPRLKKAFRKLCLNIRRQIEDERSHLQLSKFEPPLRGKFPLATYTVLVEKIDNMADLLMGMAYATRSIDRSWQRNLVSAIRDGRTEYVSKKKTRCVHQTDINL